MRWHIISPDYPPTKGGVSDHSLQVAEGLAHCGDEVIVWCKPDARGVTASKRVRILREIGAMSLQDWKRVGSTLDTFAPPRRLLVQWVPHMYGMRSMSLPFCAWILSRALLHDDEVDLIVHEPFLAFGEGGLRQNLAAAVHRLMVIMILRAARRVLVTIPAWESALRPWFLGRDAKMIWLPVPSNVPRVAMNRTATQNGVVVGHFGTYGKLITDLLEPTLVAILSARLDVQIALLGGGSEAWRGQFIQANPQFSDRVTATGQLSGAQLSEYIAACDLLIQPYPDGISARRSSAMAAIAHGKALVTNHGRLSELIWRESGAVALADDASGLAREAIRLIDDPARRDHLGAAGKGLYDAMFDLRHTISTLRQD